MARTLPLLSILLLLFIGVSSPFDAVHAQNESGKKGIEKQIKGAIEAGNAASLSEHFTNKVDLTLPETNELFSKAQAEQILKEFFEGHPPQELILEHQGTSKLKDRYRIGKLSTSEGNYRLTYFMKQVEGVSRIKKLRIELYEGDL